MNFKKLIRLPARNIARCNANIPSPMKSAGYKAAPHEVRLYEAEPALQA